MNYERLLSALLLCFLFVSIGWLAPLMVASHAPPGTYLDPVELQVENTTTDEPTQTACFTRTVSSDTTGIVIRELVLISSDTELSLTQSRSHTYFEAGTRTVQLEFELPEELDPGTYRYRVAVEFDVGTTGVTRTETITSNQFTVSDTAENTTPFSC